MKRLIVLLLLFISFCLPVSAAYYPIPADKSAQYKAEIEAVIHREAPIIRNNMNKVVRDYKKETNEDVKYTLRSIGLDTTLWNLFVEMVEITNKYVPIKKDIEPCGQYYFLEEVLYPYFKANNVSLKELYSLYDYQKIKQKEIGEFP